jgi:hypothetical protein
MFALPVFQIPQQLAATLRLTACAAALCAATVAQSAALPKLVIVSGQYQSTPYSSAFASPLTVEVIDSLTKAPLPGYSVTFTSGFGVALSAYSVTTGQNGLASVTANGRAAGWYPVTAQIAGNTQSTVTFAGLGVKKVPLSIVASDETVLAGSVPETGRYTLSGFVNGESAVSAGVFGSPTFKIWANNASAAGVYRIQVSAGSLSAANYSFVPVGAKLTIVGLNPCGMYGANSSSLLLGSYAFHLYNEQGGFTGVLTADGVSRVYGQAQSNQSGAPAPSLVNFYGIFSVGAGKRGAMTVLQSQQGNLSDPAVSHLCLAVDRIVNGIATSGRLVSVSPTGQSQAGSFTLDDGSVQSPAALSGAYVLNLQGTSIDQASGNPLRNVTVAELVFDGNGNISSGMADEIGMQMVAGSPQAFERHKLPVTGNYFYDPIAGGGVLSLAMDNRQLNLAFIAPNTRQLLLMTIDSATAVPSGSTSTVPVFFGEANLRTVTSISSATLSGVYNMELRGINPNAPNAPVPSAPTSLVAGAGAYTFDGIGTLTPHGMFNSLDGASVPAVEPAETQGKLSYTVDPATGRFEAVDPETRASVESGYIVGADELDTVTSQNGLPLYASFISAMNPPSGSSLEALSGGYSTGSTALLSPQSTGWQGVLHFDGRGTFDWLGDNDSATPGVVSSFTFKGSYAAVDGAYALTVAGHSTPDFYIYLNANSRAVLIPAGSSSSLDPAIDLPIMELNVILPPAA